MNYTPDKVLKIAKRVNNTKRSYLLVNPLQAKHIPVSPKTALEMMRALGKALYEKYPDTRLIIGFAETATAIGSAVSECFFDDCVYIHTTREGLFGEFLCFSEEHSHASEQRLYADRLGEAIAKTERIIFIDDEISTGKTLINIAESIKRRFPLARKKEFISASIINRVSKENETRLLNAGIKCEQLVRLSNEDCTEAVGEIDVEEAKSITPSGGEKYTILRSQKKIPNARLGVKCGDYKREVQEIMKDALSSLKLPKNARLLVLGTEECMYPALIFGELFEERGGMAFCHSTTRSPIGISRAENYPIKSGFKLRSFYEPKRETYIYNLEKYDCAVIISDSGDNCSEGMGDISSALLKRGCENIFFLGVG